MFGKKKDTVRSVSPIDELTTRILALTNDQEIVHQLPEFYGNELAIVSLNPEYQRGGKKYRILLERTIDGQPSGQRRTSWDSDKAKELAKWILERNGIPFQL